MSKGLKGNISRITIGDNTLIGSATITITAPNNNLTNGNFVRIKDIFYNLVPDGFYYVDHVKNNSFCVFGIVDYQNYFPHCYLIINPEGFWKKIPDNNE